MLKTDVLVVGGGLAALKAAAQALKSGLHVTIAVKTCLCSGASFYPMMDMVACQCATGDPAEDQAYLDEILDASLGMADEEMNRIYIRDIRRRVAEFPEIGVDNARRSDPKVACFAKTARPTYVWSDWKRIREKVYALAAQNDRLTVLERTQVIALLKRDGRICGAVLMSGGERKTIAARSVVLATGGFGDLFEHNLNMPDVSGDGHVLALEAGARLINLEFLQFIPGFITPAYKTVFRETALPYADGLKTADGRDLLAAWLPDEQQRSECLRLRAAHGPFTSRTLAKYFDIAMMEEILKTPGETSGFALRYSKEILKSEFTFIKPYVTWLREEKGVDITEEPIFIAPFYHAANGGIKIGTDCSAGVPGLYACGECSGGIHGADRLGGQSTGSCLVFGAIAGESAAQYAMGTTEAEPERGAAEDALAALYGGRCTIEPKALLTDIRRLMWRTGGIVRQEEPLLQALDQLRDWQAHFAAGPYLDTSQCADAVKAAHFLTLGTAILTAMENRRESRGAHYRKDFPQTDERYAVRFEVKKAGNSLLIEEEEHAHRRHRDGTNRP